MTRKLTQKVGTKRVTVDNGYRATAESADLSRSAELPNGFLDGTRWLVLREDNILQGEQHFSHPAPKRLL